MKTASRISALAIVALVSGIVPALAAAAPEATPSKVSASSPKAVKQKQDTPPGVVTPNPRPGGTGSGAKKPTTIDPRTANALGASAPGK